MIERSPLDSRLPLDRSWPDPMPSEKMIQDVFYNELNAPLHWTPDDHLDRVKALVLHGKSLEIIIHRLHRILSVQTEYNRTGLSGRQVLRRDIDDAPFIKHIGIDRYNDLVLQVLPVIRPEINAGILSNRDTQEKLDVVALTIGSVIAEAQTFSDANTRISRAIHDYIKGGLDALSVEQISDVTRNFSVPREIETLIMMQNTTQLIEYPFEAPLGNGVGRVTARAADLYLRAEEYLRSIWQVHDNGDEISLPVLLGRIRSGLPDAALGTNASMGDNVLLQNRYGPAALAATFSEDLPRSDFTVNDIERLVKTNLDLMRMRAVSIGTGMARRGIFMAIEPSDDTSRTSIVEHHWLPKNI